MTSRRRNFVQLMAGATVVTCGRETFPDSDLTGARSAELLPDTRGTAGAAAAMAASISGNAEPPSDARLDDAGGPARDTEIERGRVQVGIEVLLEQQADLIRGRHLGLVTNHTGVDRQGRSTIDLLHAHPDARLIALFGPEHGIRGEAAAGASVTSSVDSRTGLPIHSLYGEVRRPTTAMLQGIDLLVFDLQDVGARVYTYIATLIEVLRAGTAHRLPVVVLDRPNPINGIDVEGNVLNPRFTSFVGPAPVAMRYGMTVGELGRLFNQTLGIGADLMVVPLRGWQRSDWQDQTGQPWVNPSPNMRSLTAAGVYPGTVLFEGTNLSEGRGTDIPFEWAGAPWIDDVAWADRLNHASLPGVRFHPQQFTPAASKFAGQPCRGVLLEVVDRTQLQPMALGVNMVATARALHPGEFQFRVAHFDRLAGTDRVRQALERGQPAAGIVGDWQMDLQQFRAVRQPYLLY
jgi:uncharacterized protein YbbC (DUF1343 family)